MICIAFGGTSQYVSVFASSLPPFPNPRPPTPASLDSLITYVYVYVCVCVYVSRLSHQKHTQGIGYARCTMELVLMSEWREGGLEWRGKTPELLSNKRRLLPDPDGTLRLRLEASRGASRRAERHGRGQTDVVTYDALHSGRRAKDVVRWQLALQTNSECSGGSPTGCSRFTSSRGMCASCVEDGFVGGDGAGDRLDAGTPSTARSRRASATSIQHPDISICQRRNMAEVLQAVEMLRRPASVAVLEHVRA